MIVGGVLVFVGLSLLAAWLIDMRHSLPLGEYLIVPAIVVTIATKGILAGLELGLILAVILFAVNYGRVDLVREVPFGAAFRSNVDRPPGDRVILDGLAERVQILRLNGFVFFGTARGLLERISRRAQAGPIRFLLLDLRRVTGVDASGVFAFRKIALLAEASGFEVVFADASDRVQSQVQRGGWSPPTASSGSSRTSITPCSDVRTICSPRLPLWARATMVPPSCRRIWSRTSSDDRSPRERS